jgi:hypothetical protein
MLNVERNVESFKTFAQRLVSAGVPRDALMAALNDIDLVREADSSEHLSIEINDVVYTGTRSVLVSFPFFRVICDPSTSCFSDSGRLIPTVCVEQHHLAIHMSGFLKYIGFLESEAQECDQNADIPSILAFLEIAHTFSMDTIEEECLVQLSTLMPRMTAEILQSSLSFCNAPHLDLTRIIRISASCSPSCRITSLAIWANRDDIQNSPEFQQIISHAWVSLPIIDMEKLAACQASHIVLADHHASIASELCRLVAGLNTVVWCSKCKERTTNFHLCGPTMYHPGGYKCGYDAGWTCCSAKIKKSSGCTILEKLKTCLVGSSSEPFQTSVVKACVQDICNK